MMIFTLSSLLAQPHHRTVVHSFALSLPGGVVNITVDVSTFLSGVSSGRDDDDAGYRDNKGHKCEWWSGE